MEEKMINEILERYWAGESSLEDEAMLREYFQHKSLPAAHERYRSLFGYFTQETNRQMPERTDRSFDQPKPLPVAKVSRSRSLTHSLPRSLFITAIAASFALLISLSIFFTPQQQDKNHISLTADTFDDPEEAYREARKALLMVSAQLNSGRKFQQELKPIRRISEILYSDK
jgi:hypothetical protein